MPDADVPFETLVAHATGDLDRATMEAVERQLAQSAPAADIVARLRVAIETMRADATDKPGAAVLASVVASFRREIEPPAPCAAGRVGAVIAELVFDSRRRSALAGLRGDRTSYQLAYESERGRVDLQVTDEPAAAERRRVRGQIVPRGDDLPATVRLERSDRGATDRTCSTDERGRFRMSVEIGSYDAVIAFRDTPDTIIIHRLELD